MRAGLVVANALGVRLPTVFGGLVPTVRSCHRTRLTEASRWVVCHSRLSTKSVPESALRAIDYPADEAGTGQVTPVPAIPQ